MKTCSKCGAVKQEINFYADKRERDGLRHACKDCIRAYRKAHYAIVQEREIEASRKWKAANQEMHREANRKWQEANREKVSAFARKWQKANRTKFASIKASRRASGRCAWADGSKIHEIYAFAKEFREAGFDVHVDHIVPLKGKNVSGLHVEQNLRVCLANANLRKGNRQLEHFNDN